MTPEEILSYPVEIFTQEKREHYFEYGYIAIKDFVPSETLNLTRQVTNEFVEKSRNVTKSNNVFDVSPRHSYENPMLRRLKSPDEDHQEYWNLSKSLMAYVTSDLVGPSVTFHLSKLNFKWYSNSDTVKWYRDIHFFPHTNYNVLKRVLLRRY